MQELEAGEMHPTSTADKTAKRPDRKKHPSAKNRKIPLCILVNGAMIEVVGKGLARPPGFRNARRYSISSTVLPETPDIPSAIPDGFSGARRAKNCTGYLAPLGLRSWEVIVDARSSTATSGKPLITGERVFRKGMTHSRVFGLN